MACSPAASGGNPRETGDRSAGTAAVESAPPTGHDPSQPFAWVYQCTQADRFVVRFTADDSARVEWDGERVTLPQAISASGARYTDGTVTYWDKGGIARFETPADTFIDCPSRPAADPIELSRLLGYEFRAVGQEPGWLVQIDSGRRMHVLADYGEVEFFTGPPEVQHTDGVTLYRGRHGDSAVTVTVRDTPCQDVMSSEPYPATVTLEIDGRTWEGCGGAVI